MIKAFHLKEVLPKHFNSKVLYKLKCDICNTKGHLLVHQNEHTTLSILKEKTLKYTVKRCNNNQKKMPSK